MPSSMYERHLVLYLTVAVLLIPASVMGQSPAGRGQIIGLVFGYATQQKSIRLPRGENGLGAGVSLGAVVSRPHQPELHLQGAFLMFTSVGVPCQNIVPSASCRPRRELHALGTLRAALTWPFRASQTDWYAGFGLGGYFPMDEQRVFPVLAGGLDLTLGIRGLTGSKRLFLETRLAYLRGKRLYGGALSLVTGIAL